MNEAKDILELSPEAYQRIFFMEETRRMLEAFSETNDENHLLYLRNQLQGMKNLLTNLTLNWECCIPVLFRGFSDFMQHPNKLANPRKTFRTTAQMMDSISYLSQNGWLINSMIVFFDRQIKEINKLITQKKAIEEEFIYQ